MTMINWDNLPKPRSSFSQTHGDSGLFLHLRVGSTYTLRLFHKVKPIWRYYNVANKRSAITADPKNCPITIKYPDMKAKERYAIIVIDRSDNQIKIMDGPAVLFQQFHNYWEANQINPSGPDAPDWVIKVTGTPPKVEFKATALAKPSPITAEEIAALKAKKPDLDLDQIFRPTDPTRIEELLMGTVKTAAATPERAKFDPEDPDF